MGFADEDGLLFVFVGFLQGEGVEVLSVELELGDGGLLLAVEDDVFLHELFHFVTLQLGEFFYFFLTPGEEHDFFPFTIFFYFWMLTILEKMLMISPDSGISSLTIS